MVFLELTILLMFEANMILSHIQCQLLTNSNRPLPATCVCLTTQLHDILCYVASLGLSRKGTFQNLNVEQGMDDVPEKFFQA